MIFFISVLIYFFCCIGIAAYMSLIERKLIGRIQRRFGPDHCGVFGLLQPIADAIKLLFKQSSFVGRSKQSITGVLLLFTTSLYQLTLIPIPDGIFSYTAELPLIIVCHAVIAFSEILIGTTSKSKYGVIGGNRAYVQGIAGHLSFVLSIAVIISISHSMGISGFANMDNDIISIIKFIPLIIVFFIVLLMTGNRIPFDFTEAESEIVSGAYVECGGILFALIYLSDYLNLLFISALMASLFFGGVDCSMICLFLKTFGIISLIILIRATLPRYTQNTMIKISWRILIPILLLYLIF